MTRDTDWRRGGGGWRWILIVAAVAATCAPTTRADDAPVTVVEITDEVLVADCIPFGINLSYGNDSHNASPWAKDRIRASFEGTTYRQCLTGHVQDATGMSVWVDTPKSWRDVHVGATFTILNGPAKGMTGKIRQITTKTLPNEGKQQEFTYYEFDRTVPPAPKEAGMPGLLIERLALDEGFLGQPHDFWRTNAGIQDKTPRVELLTGSDVSPPGSTGRAVCRFVAPDPEQKALVRFATFQPRIGQNNGRWKISFWAKAYAGSPMLEVMASVRNPVAATQTVALTDQWHKYELVMDVANVAEPDWQKPSRALPLYFIFRVGGGEVLIDEIGAEQANEKNPTAFRDDLVATLKRLNVGSIRNNQSGGSTLDNILTPGALCHNFSSVRTAKPGPYGKTGRHPFSLPELFELCEHLGCDPWYCLPGTLHPAEVVKFMEYVGAPADVGYGKVRARLGHPKPWTDVFRSIHVEFGNEAWNSAAPYHSGGFNGSDYWKGLIVTGKSSPHYRPNVLFHPAGQATFPGRNEAIMKDAPNGDRFGVAPYMLTRVSQEEFDHLSTDESFFRWVLAWPIFRSLDPRGHMARNHEFAKKAGMEMSVYEFNHHTLGSPGVTLEDRKRIFTTLGGGLNVSHTMLLMLKEHGIRIQNAFPLASGSDSGIWDFVLTMRPDRFRVRPTFLGMEMVNGVVRGDLVKTVHGGADLRWSAEGVFYRVWNKPVEFTTYENIPALTSYAFADGPRRGLILVNLDVVRPLVAEVRFQQEPADGTARSRLLMAEKITASNEWDSEPQVTIRDETLKSFASGQRVSIPPFSMRTIVWDVK